MQIEELSLKGIKLIRPDIYSDDRGFFLETFHCERYGLGCTFVQDNYSCSKKGTIRGMHYQSGDGQAKLVSCVKGVIWDVVVDMRRESETFGKWLGFQLDDVSRHQLFVPVGFAHGFCVLSDEAHVSYKVSRFYDPKTECGFSYRDEEVGIEWPIENPVLSRRDLEAVSMSESLCAHC